jgi:hypothetical protein
VREIPDLAIVINYRTVIYYHASTENCSRRDHPLRRNKPSCADRSKI